MLGPATNSFAHQYHPLAPDISFAAVSSHLLDWTRICHRVHIEKKIKKESRLSGKPKKYVRYLYIAPLKIGLGSSEPTAEFGASEVTDGPARVCDLVGGTT